MGAEELPGGNWSIEMIRRTSSGASSALDTQDAARIMLERGVTLLLFAGGDGTARDILEAVGTSVPVLGVPAGVKMHSGVFATSPEAAGDAAARFLADPEGIGCIEAEVVDLSDDDLRAQRSVSGIFGIARVPCVSASVQAAKAGSPHSDERALVQLGREVAAEMVPDRLYLLGPGTTVAHVCRALGIQGSLLGVDAVLGGRLICRDATEEQLYNLVSRRTTSLVLGVVGGQGFLLGRGNQQISGRVLAAIEPTNVQILAAEGKIMTLNPPVLRVDLDDENYDEILTGYRSVRTRPGHSTVLKVVN